ncbi:unnamed protein product [Rangifer tarandus platyrhynchus]|uniref:Uncharacterized protein n=2 Tax=Rangifer tarandus platyrhynchus TaxID=3082113 RepID=A0AC59ZKT6_RANTA|nr:unnamed protein product [Rangifer tarandus platyrhynchus]
MAERASDKEPSPPPPLVCSVVLGSLWKKPPRLSTQASCRELYPLFLSSHSFPFFYLRTLPFPSSRPCQVDVSLSSLYWLDFSATGSHAKGTLTCFQLSS